MDKYDKLFKECTSAIKEVKRPGASRNLETLDHIHAQLSELLIRRYFNETGELPPHGHICYGYTKEYQDSQEEDAEEEIPVKKSAQLVKFTRRKTGPKKTSVNKKAQAFAVGDKYLSPEFKKFLETSKGETEH